MLEFGLAGITFNSNGGFSGPAGLVTLYEAVTNTIKNEKTIGKEGTHNSTSKVVRNVKSQVMAAKQACINQGTVTVGKKSQHYLTLLPSKAEVLSYRYMDKFGDVNSSIGGPLQLIGEAHLLEAPRAAGAHLQRKHPNVKAEAFFELVGKSTTDIEMIKEGSSGKKEDKIIKVLQKASEKMKSIEQDLKTIKADTTETKNELSAFQETQTEKNDQLWSAITKLRSDLTNPIKPTPASTSAVPQERQAEDEDLTDTQPSPLPDGYVRRVRRARRIKS